MRKSPTVVTNRMVERMQALKGTMSNRRIAALLGVSEKVVRSHTESDGSNIRKQRLDWDEIFYMVACNVGTVDIANEVGAHPTYVRKLIAKHKESHLPRAIERLEQEINQAIADGDRAVDIAAWSGRKRQTIQTRIQAYRKRSQSRAEDTQENHPAQAV